MVGGPALARARWSPPTRSLPPPSPGGSRRRLDAPFPPSPVPLFFCSPVPLIPREAPLWWKYTRVVTQTEFNLVFPSLLREPTMKTPNTPDNNSREATRLERVRLYIKLHLRQFVTQGSVIAGWRQSGGRRLGPYYRLIHRQDGRQQTLYLGRSEWLADQVRKLLMIVRKPLRDARAYKRFQASARAGLRKAKAELRRQLARFGLLLKGYEIRGLDAVRHATRWGQLALERGVPCPRIMPLLELGEGKKVAGTICAQHPPGRPGKWCLPPFSA